VRTDSDRLMQVLANLLSNAVKFSPKGDEATVTIEADDDYVRIAVRDHGPGIPDEYGTLIFNKFAQVEATDSRQKGGNGLGLSIVKETMIRLGGRVGHFPAPSGGSVFYIDVPRWTEQAASEQAPTHQLTLETLRPQIIAASGPPQHEPRLDCDP
jgi:signal transduction histidine kinase